MLWKSVLDSQLTARTFPAIITRDFYFKRLFLELSPFFFFLTSFYTHIHFHAGIYLFLGKALVSTADDNSEPNGVVCQALLKRNG